MCEQVSETGKAAPAQQDSRHILEWLFSPKDAFPCVFAAYSGAILLQGWADWHEVAVPLKPF